MLDIFSSLSAVLKRREITTDTTIFKLHYRFTTTALVAFSLVITAHQYVGQPIKCLLSDKKVVPYINTYCWIRSTFTLPSTYPRLDYPTDPNRKEKIYYKYYQWVCFVFFFQAMLFYAPRYVWKICEGGLMKSLTTGLHVAAVSEEERRGKTKVLVEYLRKHLRKHNFYAVRYFLCEFLSLVNIVGQMYLLDKFLGHEFFTYGLKVMEFSEREQTNRTDPMIYVFPRMTKCTFHKVGPSGSIQRHDALCILPLNIVNEKIFIFLWFWFIILTVLTAALVVYRVVVVVLPRIRPRLLHAKCRMASKEAMDVVLRRTKVGDWFVFCMLAQNVDPVVLREIVAELARKMETAGETPAWKSDSGRKERSKLMKEEKSGAEMP